MKRNIVAIDIDFENLLSGKLYYARFCVLWHASRLISLWRTHLLKTVSNSEHKVPKLVCHDSLETFGFMAGESSRKVPLTM